MKKRRSLASFYILGFLFLIFIGMVWYIAYNVRNYQIDKEVETYFDAEKQSELQAVPIKEILIVKNNGKRLDIQRLADVKKKKFKVGDVVDIIVY